MNATSELNQTGGPYVLRMGQFRLTGSRPRGRGEPGASVFLCGIADDQAYQPAGQHNRKIIPVLHVGNQERQQESDSKPEENSERQ